MFSACLSLEKTVRVAYLGPEGTFSHMAVKRQFGLSARAIPIKTIAAVFEEVERGGADLGVVPVENSTEGMINHTLDSFVDSDLKISAEIMLKISLCLLARAEVDLERVERVYSIPVALAQCRRWLATNLPRATVVESPSTAEAARSAHGDAHGVAVASEMAAKLYDLQVLKRNIEDLTQNVTRFLVLGRQQAESDRTRQDLGAADHPRPAGDPVPGAGWLRRAGPEHDQDREPALAAPALGVRLFRRRRRARTRSGGRGGAGGGAGTM